MHTIRPIAYLLLLAAMMLALPGATCVPEDIVLGVTEEDTTPPPDSGDPEWIQQVIERVNAERAGQGLNPLVSNNLLAQAAAGHAERMAELGFFDHIDPYNQTAPWDRAEAVGYDYVCIAENIAAGQPTPEMVMDGWMKSPGHRANILSPDVTEIGVAIYEGGSYGIYWVQLFGNPG